MFAGEARLGELLHSGRAVMLDFDSNASLSSLQGLFGGRLHYLAADAEERFGSSAMFVRPDGVVVWATRTMPGLNKVRTAICRWLQGLD